MLLTQDKDSKLVIVDDAGKLKPSGLGFFHELRENTQSCVSFVFVGLPYFKLNLDNWRMKNVQGVGEFSRRIETWYEELPPLSQEEKIHCCKTKLINSVKATNEMCRSSKSISELEFMVNKFLELGEDNIVGDLHGAKRTRKFEHDE